MHDIKHHDKHSAKIWDALVAKPEFLIPEMLGVWTTPLIQLAWRPSSYREAWTPASISGFRFPGKLGITHQVRYGQRLFYEIYTHAPRARKHTSSRITCRPKQFIHDTRGQEAHLQS